MCVYLCVSYIGASSKILAQFQVFALSLQYSLVSTVYMHILVLNGTCIFVSYLPANPSWILKRWIHAFYIVVGLNTWEECWKRVCSGQLHLIIYFQRCCTLFTVDVLKTSRNHFHNTMVSQQAPKKMSAKRCMEGGLYYCFTLSWSTMARRKSYLSNSLGLCVPVAPPNPTESRKLVLGFCAKTNLLLYGVSYKIGSTFLPGRFGSEN